MSSFIANEKEIEEIMEKYRLFQKESKNPYVAYFFKTDKETVTVFKNNRVLIQSNSKSTYQKKSQKLIENIMYHAGSDESGVGDYFGPLTVCACVVDDKHIELLSQLDIKDSKQLSDEKIKQIAPELMQHLIYSLLVLDNKKYNEQQPIHNAHGLKAILHNQAYLNLQKKIVLPQLRVVDQFCSEKNYYQYLKDKEVVSVHLETKAENKYLAVGCASIIARYAYIIAMENLSKKYGIIFPYGAGDKVNNCIELFVQKYGKERLNEVSKVHFSNTNKNIFEKR